MHLHPYLSFNGNCEEAFRFYEKALNGKITFLMKNGDSPMAAQVPKEQHGWVMHVTLTWGDQVLGGADAWGGQYKVPQGFTVAVDLADAAEAERIFRALSEGAKIEMPLQETFWAQKFGVLVDRFGTPWMINCGKQA